MTSPAQTVAPRHARRRARLRRHLRTALLVSLVLSVAASMALSLALHHYTGVVDRRLRHSAAFAARPRVQAVPQRNTVAHIVPALAGKRRQTHTPAFDALPPQLVQAVVAIEDRRFFSHKGVDYLRTARCAVEDTVTLHAACGGSTITQQLARVDFLTQQKTLRRKVAEFLVARRLEQRLTKQQIFAMYAGAINLGQRGPKPIRGFQEASRAYFGQDLSHLDLAQCALLAGMVHAPNFDNPVRHPERARRRRNLVLDAMVQTGAITRGEAETAKAEPLNLLGWGIPEILPAFPEPSHQG